MTNEEKLLLLKDLCARLPYGVKVHLDTDDKNFDTDLVGLTSNITANIHNIENYETIEECFIWNIKPYLRSMESMTEKETYIFRQDILNEVEARCIHSLGCGKYSLAFTEANDWLNEHHFDYRGLIPMGLALEAKEGMYKTE